MRHCAVFYRIILIMAAGLWIGAVSFAGGSSPAGNALKADFIYLDGSKAKLVGKGVGNQEGYVRNWNGVGSGAEWKFKAEKAGKYYLHLEMASPGSEGGQAALNVDGVRQTVADIPSTQNFNDFKIIRFAELELSKGEHTLSILAEKLKNTWLMDIKFGILTMDSREDAAVKLLEEQEKAMANVIAQGKDFPGALTKVRALLPDIPVERNKEKLVSLFRQQYAHQAVWLEQDTDEKLKDFLYNRNAGAWDPVFANLAKTCPNPQQLEQAVASLKKDKTPADSPKWARLYEQFAWARRVARLDKVRASGSEIVYAKHHVFGSISGIYLITETEGTDLPSALCTVNLDEDKPGQFAPTHVLFDPGEGMVRDPEISFDAKKLLFAMRPTKKHFDSTYSKLTSGIPEMNYQIYEMDLESKAIRPLTSTETYGSSFEPCYLPNGDIMFSSSRIVQHITCGWGDHSNLFIMNKDGKYARRVGFDQTNTAFPVLLNDGRVVFTRRDYNDRGQSSAHALFVMNSDGTNQTEFYGNQTGLPNSFHHARPIPNSHKIITIIGGYHTTQGAKLALIDTKLGVEKDEGLIEMPGYKKPLVGDGYDDNYGKQGVQYSNPYALNEKDYIVSIAERNARNVHYGLYYLNDLGERELLASDPNVSCLQPILKAPRKKAPHRPTFVDYSKDDGIFYVQNVYYGEAAKGIKPGSVKKIRVIEMLFKNSTIGTSKGVGPGGCWDTVIPSGHGLATFDSKRILGDATVYPDGSAKFRCQARKPIYFQLLDENNRVVQTMRSWATLMPNENFSCVGCHENKDKAPLAGQNMTIALRKDAEQLKPFYGNPRAFSFINEVQPIFDKHCISCHSQEGKARQLVLTREPYLDDHIAKKRFYRSYFELTNARPENGHKPEEFGFYQGDPIWGKRVLGKRMPDEPNRYVSWYTRFELMKAYPPYRTGSIRSGLVKALEKGHQNVKLSDEEMDKIRAWIDLNIPFAGEYDESNLWTDAEKKLYRERVDERLRNEQIESRNIREFIKDGQPF